MPMPTHCFYRAGETNIQDVAVMRNGEWRGGYGGQTEEEIKAESGAILMFFDDAVRALTAAERSKYVKPPRRVTKEDFWHALEVLPPYRWRREGGAESFHVSERITGNLVDWYVRIGEEYWHLVESATTDHGFLVDRVKRQASQDAK